MSDIEESILARMYKAAVINVLPSCEIARMISGKHHRRFGIREGPFLPAHASRPNTKSYSAFWTAIVAVKVA